MAVMEGTLSKWTNVMKGWQHRWVVLDYNAGLVSYYTTKEKMMRGARRGCVRLKGAMIGIDDDDCSFTITVDGKLFHFQATDVAVRERWIRALEETRLHHAELLQKHWDPQVPVPSIEDFNKKLTETDAYLQIIMDQVKTLESRIEKCTDETQREKCSLICEKANVMLESIKHSIVLLQITKNLAHPVNGIYQPVQSTRDPQSVGGNKPIHMSRSTQSKSSDAVDAKGQDDDSIGSMLTNAAAILDTSLDASVEPGIEPGVECFEDAKSEVTSPGEAASKVSVKKTSSGLLVAPNQSRVQATSIPDIVSLVVPATSYSSSEDEDFYDAEDLTGPTAGGSMPTKSGSKKEENDFANCESGQGQSQRRQQVTPMAGKIDYDAIYEDDVEEDLGSVESHGSVISHLMSQVRLGMDLTKVVLPTFILERRSLLEMYSDFFAHPDIFVSIADFCDPCDRMVQVARWYLSAFHAGRKSSVAKKPYNPILGEIFRCHFDVPGMQPTQDTVDDGPLPWISSNQLSFIAEQVSHHPPISAFYAEHYNKRISLSGHIWTKSKFMGLSIGVHMIGQGCVSLLDYDEEYILTFPSGYGRSILTVPWVELGGSTSITCAKTGYSANIDFLTKPFYGGKKHRISAEVFQPGDKKPFLNVTGEWNGIMHGKWLDGRVEVFVDTTNVPIVKKKVNPIKKQETFESRRLWKDVTAGLRYRNIDKATEAKYALEKRQREEALVRKETNSKWETRFFHEVAGNWIYDSPLQRRLNISIAPNCP